MEQELESSGLAYELHMHAATRHNKSASSGVLAATSKKPSKSCCKQRILFFVLWLIVTSHYLLRELGKLHATFREVWIFTIAKFSLCIDMVNFCTGKRCAPLDSCLPLIFHIIRMASLPTELNIQLCNFWLNGLYCFNCNGNTSSFL